MSHADAVECSMIRFPLLWIFILGTVALRSSPAYAAPVAIIDDSTEHLALNPYIEFLLDRDRRLTLAEVQNPKTRQLFGTTKKRSVQLGVTPAAAWIRFELESRAQQKRSMWLEAGQGLLDEARVYVQQADGSFIVRTAGRIVPMSTRELRVQPIVFRIELAPGERRTIYLRLISEDGLYIEPDLWSAAAFQQDDRRTTLFNGGAYGVLLFMSLYNLALFLFTRQRVFALYSLHVLSFALYFLNVVGFLPFLLEGLVEPTVRWPQQLTVLAMLTTGLLYVRELLDTAQTMPRIDRILRLEIYLCVIEFLVGRLIPHWVDNALITCNLLLVFTSLVGAGIIRWRSGFSPARYYVLGWSFFITMVVLANVILPEIFTFTRISVASSVIAAGMVGFFSLSLVDRFRNQLDHIARLHAASRRFVPYEFLSLLGHKELPEVKRDDYVNREMTIFFIDIRSFSRMVENMSPEQSIQFVNEYLAHIEPAITAHGGIIDKYIGDAVMALFENADQAVKAAIATQRAIDSYNNERTQRGDEPIKAGIGLNTGSLVLGTVGSRERISCTVLGGSVNLAARVEGMTKRYEAKLVITEATFKKLSEPMVYEPRKLDRVIAKGMNTPVTIYEILACLPEDLRRCRVASRTDFEAGLASYAAGDLQGALAKFAHCQEIAAEDHAVALYVQRCQQLLTEGVPKSFDGVVHLDSK